MKHGASVVVILAGLAGGFAPLAEAQVGGVGTAPREMVRGQPGSQEDRGRWARYSKAAWVVDNFEDGNIDGWLVEGVNDCTASTSALAASGSYSMRIDGGSGTHFGCRYLDVTGSKPTGVGVHVRANTTNTHDTYFILGDAGSGKTGNPGAIYFKGRPDGTWEVFDGTSHICGPRVADQWYAVDFVIDWACKMYDVRIDGVLKQSNIPFYRTATDSFDKIHVYNWSDTTARYDQIVFSTPPISPLVFGDGFERGSTCRWTNVVP